MSPVDLLGWVAAAVGTLGLLPQTVKLVRDRDTAGISLLFWQALLGVTMGWTGHGVLIGAPNMIVPNFCMALISSYTLLLIGRQRALSSWRVFGPGIAVGVAASAVDLTFGAAVFGTAVLVPGAFGVVVQIIGIARDVDLSGLSPLFLAWSVMTQLVWLSWGILTVEWAILIAASMTGLLSLTALVWYVVRRMGAPALGQGAVTSGG